MVAAPMSWASMGVIIAQDVLPVFVPRMITVTNCLGLFPAAYDSDVEVLVNINDDTLTTENLPRNLASFWGGLDSQRVINYERVIFHHPQRDVQIVFEVVPAVSLCRVQDNSEPRNHAAT